MIIGPRLVSYIIAISLSGCAGNFQEIGREPALSSLGHGLPPQALAGGQTAGLKPLRSSGNIWNERTGYFFRDPRARETGDILTIVISIDDKAKLDGTFDRSRLSTWGAALDFLANVAGKKNGGNANGNWNSSTTTKGSGSVNRAETIKLSLAGVVTSVLPNGNLIIQGSQEIRVNFELRVLQITGIVHPSDISRDNTVPYDKIAETRISYGGRGRVMEVQQPAYGHQLLDRVFPF